MLNQLLTKARKIQFISDWLAVRKAERDTKALGKRFPVLDPKVDPADFDEWRFEMDLIWDPIKERRSQRLISRARRLGVRVPNPPRREDDLNWDISPVTHGYSLSDTAEERLKREIRAEQRQNYDEGRKWATLVLSILAFVLALVSLLTKVKSDPCTRNYYRSDTGECVFALQKPQPQAATAAPATKPSPTKPKP